MMTQKPVRVLVPNSFVPVLSGIYAWQVQGWIGAIIAYVGVIGLIGLLLVIAERGGWSLKKFLRVRFAVIVSIMALVGIGSTPLCDASVTACSSLFF